MTASAFSQTAIRHRRFEQALFAAVLALICFRFWTSLCFFPLTEWNNVRLEPTFLIAAGSTPYPDSVSGPLTTWIYGPTTLMANLPAVLAGDTASALLIAGAINLLIAVIPAVLGVWALTCAPHPISTFDRGWALLLTLGLWPNTSLQYIQADNVALAFGLISNLCLLKFRPPARLSLVMGSLGATLAVWSKQTALPLVAAQLLWLGLSVGWKEAFRYLVFCAVCGLVVSMGFIAWFGFDGLWLNLVQIPGRLPFVDDVADRTRYMWAPLSLYVLVPILGLMAARQTPWRRDSPWLLPILSWLCLLPLAVTSLYKVGGAPNSLNVVLYLLPMASIGALQALRRIRPTIGLWVAVVPLAITIQQLASSPALPLSPLTAHLTEAENLVRAYPGRIYFPWHPLVSHFGEGHLYHAEDGLFTRSLARVPLDRQIIRRDFPPQWSFTAIAGWRERDQSVYKQYQPLSYQTTIIGKWTVYFWPASGAQSPDGEAPGS